jgi:hypothetical protein
VQAAEGSNPLQEKGIALDHLNMEIGQLQLDSAPVFATFCLR